MTAAAARLTRGGPLTRFALTRAARVFDDDLAVFEELGWHVTDRPSRTEARLEDGDGGFALVIRLVQEGRMLGGTFALELSAAEPVFPPTRGLSGRGRGVVRLRGVHFRARSGDTEGRRLSAALGADERLAAALSAVDFERVRVDPDGCPVIGHLGGSLVWVTLPPLVRATPLVPGQAAAAARALREFDRCGREQA